MVELEGINVVSATFAAELLSNVLHAVKAVYLDIKEKDSVERFNKGDILNPMDIIRYATLISDETILQLADCLSKYQVTYEQFVALIECNYILNNANFDLLLLFKAYRFSEEVLAVVSRTIEREDGGKLIPQTPSLLHLQTGCWDAGRLFAHPILTEWHTNISEAGDSDNTFSEVLHILNIVVRNLCTLTSY